jgi:integrase
MLKVCSFTCIILIINAFESNQSDPSVYSETAQLIKDPEIEGCTPPEVAALAAAAVSKLIPEKSRNLYEKNYLDFLKWCEVNNVQESHYSENVILAFVSTLARTYAPSTMWTKFSMLRKSLTANGHKQALTLPKVEAYLKGNSKGHIAKKAETFSREQIEKYLIEASDETHLHYKVIVLFGLFGACRKSELTSMLLEDVSDEGPHLCVAIRASKTGPRNFVVVGSENKGLDAIIMFRKYIATRTKNAPSRLFLTFRAGKCINAPMGKNTIGKVPSIVARFNGLLDFSKYTGHALRRTSATWMANAGVDMINMKRFGGWKSETAVEGYIAESITNKKSLAMKLEGKEAVEEKENCDKSIYFDDSSESKQPVINVAGCSNCTITFKIKQ